MSILTELLREIDKHKERAKSLVEKLAEVYPEMTLAFQLKRFIDELFLLRQDFQKLIEEQESLREEQIKLRQDFNKMTEEIKKLRKEQIALREDFKALREEQIRLREDFKALREEQIRLREDFNRMMRIVTGLQETYKSLNQSVKGLWEVHRRLESAMIAGFGELRKFAGVSFEEFVRSFLSETLRSWGVLPKGGMLEERVVEGEEINMFYEDPLIVGEATAYADSEDEVNKLLRKAEAARKKYGREPKMFLIILSANQDVADKIYKLSDQYGIKTIIGKKVKPKKQTHYQVKKT